jgi:hypothetical protein
VADVVSGGGEIGRGRGAGGERGDLAEKIADMKNRFLRMFRVVSSCPVFTAGN